METSRQKELKNRMEKDCKKWVANVKNMEKKNGLAFELNTNFSSDQDGIENIMHKIELDLMTNLHNGFSNPIEVKIIEVKQY